MNKKENHLKRKAIFVCGCSRSGTTLLGSLLGAGSNCITTPESQFITDISTKIYRSEMKNSYFHIRRAFQNHFRLKLWDINEEIDQLNQVKIGDTVASLTWSCVNLYAEKKGKKSWDTWIDHTPTHVKFINLLSSYFPNSYYIHLIRDGRGVFSSVKHLDWGPAGAIQGAYWWSSRISYGLSAEQAYPGKMLRIRFEDLIYNTENEVKKICKFTGLRFSSTMVNGTGFNVPEYTLNNHNLIGKPPDSNVCEKWKTNLSQREIEIFESLVGPILKYLGYELQYGFKAKSPNRFERLIEIIVSRTIKKLVGLFKRQSRKMRI